MMEFVFKLFIREREEGRGPARTRKNFACIKAVTSANGFVMDGFQIKAHGVKGIFRFPEADELGMTGIAFCLSLQNFACQEAFPPQGNQADSIQVRGVE